MSRKTEPVITANTKNEEYTRITFQPDLKKFGMDAMDADLESLLKKRVVDMAGCVRNIKVILNNERVKVKGFRQYIDLYLNSDPAVKAPPVIHEIASDRWEIGFTLSEGQFQQVSHSQCLM